MDKCIDQYIEIRDCLYNKVQQMCEIYFTKIWDPLMKYLIIKETKQLVTRELAHDFPRFPVDYLPQVKFRIDEKDYYIEAGIQIFLNKYRNLYFLGNIEHGGADYDLYCRESFDPNFSYVFYARYGHDDDSFMKGSREPAAEYMTGIVTPLSIAYSFAVEEGFIQ